MVPTTKAVNYNGYFSNKVYSIDKSSIEQAVKKKHLNKTANSVVKLSLQVDIMQKAEKTVEKKKELTWLYSQTDGLLKTIHRLMSGKQRAARRCKRARRSLPSRTLTGSVEEKARTMVQPLLR